MKGNFKSINKELCIIISVLFFGVFPCFCLFADSDAAIIAISVVPMVIGILPLAYAANVPCAYDADEKRLRMKAGLDERTFRYGDIRDISCKYLKNEGGRAVAQLTITDFSGEESVYTENYDVDITELLNDPENTKRPQLFQLCDYVKSEKAKGAAA